MWSVKFSMQEMKIDWVILRVFQFFYEYLKPSFVFFFKQIYLTYTVYLKVMAING